jgi:hypothetical protein
MLLPSAPAFEESVRTTPLRDLKLDLHGTRLEPLIEEFQHELERVGLRSLRPVFYLSTEWGVPFGTIAIGIPFYLARPDLVTLHAEYVGHIEGFNERDILRYFRHEMGHVVNYAYKLYEEEEWVTHFGSITQPYVEEYRPQPFSTRFVQHLPGWYAQKHPDEDWAETFAVWMTPKLDWQREYANWPGALAKLTFCQRRVTELRTRAPLVTDTTLDEDVKDLPLSLRDFYAQDTPGDYTLPAGLDGALRSIFEDFSDSHNRNAPLRTLPAAELISRIEQQLAADIYRWTGHFPERTRVLLRLLAQRANELQQMYAPDREPEVLVAFTAFVATLATNYVYRGSYLVQA